MRLLIGVLAASILGAEGPKGSDAPMLSYQLTILEMNGLDWRSTLYPQLKPVVRQGPSTVWSAPRRTSTAIVEKAERTLAAPSLTALPGVRAFVAHNISRKLVRDFGFCAESGVLLASCEPKLENASEGFSAQVTGRKLDQGILISLNLDDQQVIAVHPVICNKANPAPQPPGTEPRVLMVQVPEIARTTVSGEWLIPGDEVLVISLGAHTVAGEDGKAVVCERLALVEATTGASERPSGNEASAHVIHPTPGFSVPSVPVDVAFPMPMPASALPSRSLPLAIGASGEPEPLPPLPDDIDLASARSESSDPLASPQSRIASPGHPIPWKKSVLKDTASGQAGFTVEPPCCDAACDGPAGKLVAGGGPLTPPVTVKSFRINVPMIGNIDIKVEAKVAPETLGDSGTRLLPIPAETR